MTITKPLHLDVYLGEYERWLAGTKGWFAQLLSLRPQETSPNDWLRQNGLGEYTTPNAVIAPCHTES